MRKKREVERKKNKKNKNQKKRKMQPQPPLAEYLPFKSKFHSSPFQNPPSLLSLKSYFSPFQNSFFFPSLLNPSSIPPQNLSVLFGVVGKRPICFLFLILFPPPHNTLSSKLSALTHNNLRLSLINSPLHLFFPFIHLSVALSFEYISSLLLRISKKGRFQTWSRHRLRDLFHRLQRVQK